MLNINQNIKQQAGVTLIETMIGLALSMVVVSSMVALMSNSLGSATRIIQMTQLSDELRNNMSMLTRDMRRANYNANAYQCYANSDCGADVNADVQVAGLTIESNIDNISSCLIFNLDRDQDGGADSYRAGGFRHIPGTSGYLEMWVGVATATPACGDAPGADNWVAMTDPDFVNITTFWIDDSDSVTASMTEEGGSTLNQLTRQVSVEIKGKLILDPTITRHIEDTIKVRNDYVWNP
jgi:Tfp pilus assembly protein PilW